MLYEPAPIPEKTTSNRKSYQFMLYFKQKSQRVQHESDYLIGSCCKECRKASNALQRDSARIKRNQTPDLPTSLTHSQNNAILYQYLLSLIRGRDERNDKTK